jgi:hypothetical protein
LDVPDLLYRVRDANFPSPLIENAEEDLLFVLTGHITASKHPKLIRTEMARFTTKVLKKI